MAVRAESAKFQDRVGFYLRHPEELPTVQQESELQMPAWFADVNGFDMPKDSNGQLIPYELDDWYALAVDRAGIKRSLIETNKTQSNLTVTDDEMRENPEMVKAAILAELRRWVDNSSFRRQPRREAQNLLTSRYVMT